MRITTEELEAGRVDLSGVVDPDGAPVGPIHPGEILAEEFMAPLGLSAYALARALGVPRNRVSAIINGDRAITAETALRLGRYFGTSPQWWLNMQAFHDLEVARIRHGREVEHEVRPRAA